MDELLLAYVKFIAAWQIFATITVIPITVLSAILYLWKVKTEKPYGENNTVDKNKS